MKRQLALGCLCPPRRSFVFHAGPPLQQQLCAAASPTQHRRTDDRLGPDSFCKSPVVGRAPHRTWQLEGGVADHTSVPNSPSVGGAAVSQRRLAAEPRAAQQPRRSSSQRSTEAHLDDICGRDGGAHGPLRLRVEWRRPAGNGRQRRHEGAPPATSQHTAVAPRAVLYDCLLPNGAPRLISPLRLHRRRPGAWRR